MLNTVRGASPAELIEYSRDRLAAYKYSREVEIVDSLPGQPPESSSAGGSANPDSQRPQPVGMVLTLTASVGGGTLAGNGC
jgi:hypothetical protein